MNRAAVATFAALVAVAGAGACGGRVVEDDSGASVIDSDASVNDASRGAAGSSDGSSSGSGSSGDDASTTAGLYNANPPARACPQRTTVDGTMTPIDDGNGGSFCMDKTEVTREAYADFLSTNPAQTSAPGCGGKTDFTVSTSGVCQGAVQDGDSPTLPVSCVDWCDAAAFCAWSGKRLCSAIGEHGLAVDVDSVADAKRDEWFRACSAGGTRSYPYGIGYDDVCDAKGTQSGTWATQEVGFFTGCIDATRHVFDLSGNVEEWENACNAEQCYVRGGAYDDIMPGTLACAAQSFASMFEVKPTRGFRCCAD